MENGGLSGGQRATHSAPQPLQQRDNQVQAICPLQGAARRRLAGARLAQLCGCVLQQLSCPGACLLRPPLRCQQQRLQQALLHLFCKLKQAGIAPPHRLAQCVPGWRLEQ